MELVRWRNVRVVLNETRLIIEKFPNDFECGIFEVLASTSIEASTEETFLTKFSSQASADAFQWTMKDLGACLPIPKTRTTPWKILVLFTNTLPPNLTWQLETMKTTYIDSLTYQFLHLDLFAREIASYAVSNDAKREIRERIKQPMSSQDEIEKFRKLVETAATQGWCVSITGCIPKTKPPKFPFNLQTATTSTLMKFIDSLRSYLSKCVKLIAMKL